MTPDLSVDRSSEVPLGTQLAWKLRTAIATGVLSPGDRLPGVRELAETASVNVNTVRTVYARLEERGLVTTHHGRGTFVAADADPREDLARLAATAADRAREAGLDPRELAAALFVGGGPAPPEPGDRASSGEQAPSSERARRKMLRAEIARLEREVVQMGRLGDPATTRSAAPGRILTADELEEIRSALVARVAEMQRDREDALHRAADEPVEAGAEERRYREAGVWTGPASRVAWTS